MTTVAQSRPFVIGVDTHARTHTLVVLVAPIGEQLGCEQFPASAAGMRRAVDWAGRCTGGDLAALWAIEGIGSYGAQLANVVARAGYEAVEAPKEYVRTRRRGAGKSDSLDAAAIATAALGQDTAELCVPRQYEGVRTALRVLVGVREQMTAERTAKVNALTALVRTVDLGIDARHPLSGAQIIEISHWRSREEDLGAATARIEAVRLAKRIVAIDVELKENHARTAELVRESPAAPLLEKKGIGPVTAAVVLTAWSHLGRVRSEAAFAALAGVSPIPASSGNTVRYRLNRGGDRRLNHALHMATLSRMAHDPETRAYVERRTAEGKSRREIRRCLKRYLARHLYRALNALHCPTAAAA